MTQDEVQSSLSVIADRVRQLRQRRGWSAAALAERCAELGEPGLNRSVIANLESGRRSYVTVADLLVLAVALDVAPVHLLVPPWPTPEAAAEGEPADDAAFQVTPTVVGTVHEVRAWVRGEQTLRATDSQRFHLEIPKHEWAARLQALAERTGGEIRYTPGADG